MAKQRENETTVIYLSADERRLLAKIAQRRGVGADYLALRDGRTAQAAGRPIPRWLGRRAPAESAPAKQQQTHQTTQSRRCHTCTHLASQPGDDHKFACDAGVWTLPLQQQSLRTSHRLRVLSLTCSLYAAVPQAQHSAPHHCRACRELVATAAAERYVCGRGVWTTPMKPLSVANARRIQRLSAACEQFTPRPDHWLPRS